MYYMYVYNVYDVYNIMYTVYTAYMMYIIYNVCMNLQIHMLILVMFVCAYMKTLEFIENYDWCYG